MSQSNERQGALVPEHGDCFVCGTSNPSSIGVRWYFQDDKSMIGYVTLTHAQQGPPHHAHGGASAAMLDEAMGSAAWANGHKVMTVAMTTQFRKAVPLGVPLEIHGSIDRIEGRKLFTKSAIVLPDGTVAVECDGIFVDARAQFEKNAAFKRDQSTPENDPFA